MDAPTDSSNPPVAVAPERRRLAAGAAISLITQVAVIAVAGITSIVVARLLGPAGTGTFVLALTLFGFAFLLFTFGLNSGITYFVSHGAWSIRSAFRESYVAALGMGALGAAAAFTFYAITRESVFQGIGPSVAIVVVVVLPFGMVWSFSAAIALGCDRYEAYGSLQLVQAAASLVFAVGLAILFGVSGAVAGFAISHVVTAVAGAGWVIRYARVAGERLESAAPSVSQGSRQLGRALRFGVRAWGADVLQLISYRLDIFILAAFTASADVGIYSVAVTITSLGWLLPHALQTVLFPRIASLDAAARADDVASRESDEVVSRAVRHGVILVAPTAAVLAVLLQVGVPLLYGPAFTKTVDLGFILIPGVVALGLTKVLSAIVTGRGFPVYNFYIGFIGAPITIVAYFLLIPWMKAPGAAIASTFSYLITTVLSLIFFRKVTRISLRVALRPSLKELADYGEALRHFRSALGSSAPLKRIRLFRNS